MKVGPRARTGLLLIAPLVLTLLSSGVERRRLEVQDWDCPPLPQSCARPVLVAGFPFAYMSDYHGISVVGKVSLIGSLLGEDLFHKGAFVANIAVYALALLLMLIAYRRLRPHPTPT